MNVSKNRLNANVKDLSGQRFGRWTVVRFGGRIGANRAYSWLCRCDCGTEHRVRTNDLLKGKSQGCAKCSVSIQNLVYNKKGS